MRGMDKCIRSKEKECAQICTLFYNLPENVTVYFKVAELSLIKGNSLLLALDRSHPPLIYLKHVVEIGSGNICQQTLRTMLGMFLRTKLRSSTPQ